MTRIRGPVVVIVEVLRGHDPERADGRQRSTLRAPQPVFAVAGIVNNLSVTPARQGQAARERFGRVGAFSRIAFTIRPSRIMPTVVRAITVVLPIAALVVVLLDSVRG